MDVIFMAVRAALFDTRIPKLIVEQSSGNAHELEFELLPDEQEMLRLNVIQVPLCITLTKVFIHCMLSFFLDFLPLL